MARYGWWQHICSRGIEGFQGMTRGGEFGIGSGNCVKGRSFGAVTFIAYDVRP